MILQGQVAIVTGSGQGIGKAVALRFAREEAAIAVSRRTRHTAVAPGQG